VPSETSVHANPMSAQARVPSLSVDLRRVELDKRALRAALAGWPSAPSLLQADLLLQYA